ncbi:DNA-binding transcriptional regulator, MarR family [Pelagirhabdus alkalitolerans]|uniref:DNA-binding transcriptional regulator, MarR family n=1 Tax=Pelagirhabdus alkalitolerans TaxID=1612202 RepID=A0A1G6ILJ7_9BACI|nr:MarR family transcriptional regulator [Pelagirhabdus alkalitolerans]SDC06875.1 DNA-binding transcriptional regulator, MarR family [Pelagirhabdus alkalitolerans]
MPDDMILYIRLVYFALEREKNNYFEHQNITASQGDLLLYLGGCQYHNKEVNQKDIENHFQLTNPTVTGLINRLEEKGFVKRVKSEVDGRNKFIHLTDDGVDVLKQFMGHKDEIEAKLFKGLSQGDIDQTIDHLKVFLDNLNQNKE